MQDLFKGKCFAFRIHFSKISYGAKIPIIPPPNEGKNCILSLKMEVFGRSVEVEILQKKQSQVQNFKDQGNNFTSKFT